MAGNDGNPYCLLVVDGIFGVTSTRALQWKLNALGQNPPLVIDGGFGPLTSKALENHLGLLQDGDLVPGSHATNDCLTLQHWCATIGFGVGLTGVWDANTSKGTQLGLNSTRF
jgi:hypothetical protein